MADGILTIPLKGTAQATDRAQPGRDVAASAEADFVAGAENHLAVVAFEALLQNLPTSLNPVVIYGPHGSGKSHLACGLAQWWRQAFPEASVQYLTGADFARHYSAALAAGHLEDWRELVRQADLFVLEDLGELVGKTAAQQEFLHTWDALSDREAHLVVTCRSLPSHWPGLSPALRSRLSQALAIPLAHPTQSTRRAILASLAERRGITLSRQVLDKLAVGISGGVPALIAAIGELELSARAERRSPDTARVQELVESRDQVATPTVREIARLVAKHFGLKLSELKSPERRRALVAARCLAMYLARQLTPASLSEIGEYFGGRDHTTVLHGCRRTEKMLTRDVALRQAVAQVKRTLASA